MTSWAGEYDSFVNGDLVMFHSPVSGWGEEIDHKSLNLIQYYLDPGDIGVVLDLGIFDKEILQHHCKVLIGNVIIHVPFGSFKKIKNNLKE